MPRKTLDSLSEPMFYVLMALQKQPLCGADIAQWVSARTEKRIVLGPGTLYTILGKLTDEQMIRETAVDGRRRTYETTEDGDRLYGNEVARLRRCLQDADAVLHFDISSEFSSCWQNACIAAEGLPVYCIDSRNLSTGIAMLLAEAADRAEAGMAPEAIVEELKGLYAKVDVSFIVDRLDYLYKGGRCSMVAMLGANVLHLRPCIEVTDGKMVVGKKYRGTYERCLRQYLADRLKDKDALSAKRVFLTHTGLAPAALETIRTVVAEEIPFAEIHEVRAGCSITSHCGESTFGIILLRK